jgi:cytochrome c oxidase subunit I
VIALFAARALGVNVDPLLMKNLTFFFGHILVNITMYLGVAMVYELLPTYAGRPWKTNRVVALAWDAVLFLILFAYFHHLYMDFAQPEWIQKLGQICSYGLAVPAGVVSIFGTLTLVYAARMRWTLASTLLFLGIMGWGVGGIAAVIDSTVEVNLHFHNTLWVPAHFHTYYLMGVVLIVLGLIDHVGKEISGLEESAARSKLTVALLLIGGYGFLSHVLLGRRALGSQALCHLSSRSVAGHTLCQDCRCIHLGLAAGYPALSVGDGETEFLPLPSSGSRCLAAPCKHNDPRSVPRSTECRTTAART